MAYLNEQNLIFCTPPMNTKKTFMFHILSKAQVKVSNKILYSNVTFTKISKYFFFNNDAGSKFQIRLVQGGGGKVVVKV